MLCIFNVQSPGADILSLFRFPSLLAATDHLEERQKDRLPHWHCSGDAHTYLIWIFIVQFVFC